MHSILRSKILVTLTASFIVIAGVLGFFLGEAETGQGVMDSPKQKSYPTALASKHSNSPNSLATRVAPIDLSSNQSTLGAAKKTPLQLQLEQALSEPNPTKKLQALSNVLASLTADNWREALSIFSAQSRGQGKDQLKEFLLFVQRAGEVAGVDAMAHFTARGNVEACRACLTGWASVNPHDAVTWLESQPNEGLRDRIFGAAVRGMLQQSPDAAIALLEQLPIDYRKSYTQDLIPSIIRNEGIDRAFQVFGGIATRAQAEGTLGSAYVRQLFDQLVNAVSKYNRKKGTPAETASWLSQFLGQPFLEASQVATAAQDLAASNPIDAVAWLDRVNPQPGQGEPTGYRAVMQQWVSKFGVESATSWLSSQVNHPAYDRMAFGIATTIQDPARFSSVVATIKDAQLRSLAVKYAPAPKSNKP